MSKSVYKPNSSKTPFLGDLMLTFQVQRETFPSRTVEAGWEKMLTSTTWQLWQQPASASWHGFPCFSDSLGEWHIWVLGELYGVPSQRTISLITDVVTGRAAATVLNGHFLLWAWHEKTNRWHLWTDRFGTVHAYLAHKGQQTVISTFFPAAAAVSRRQLDWLGLTGFFAFGFLPQDRTYFEDIRILRPASHYIFDDTGRLLQQEHYWQWWHEPNWGRSYDDTVAEFAHLFGQVMADQTREGRIAVPISGGLDSRSTVAAITTPEKNPDPRLWSYSYGYSDDSVETRIARRVAVAHGLPFQAFTIQPYLFERLEQILAWTEGFQDITQCRQAFVLNHIAHHADYLIAGLWGDVWFDDMGLLEQPSETINSEVVHKHVMKKMLKGGREWLLAHLVQPQLGGQRAADVLREAVEQELAPLQHIADPDFRVKAYKTEQWSFRWSLPPIRVFQAAAFPRLVFYDTRLTDFFCTVPSQFVAKRQLQIDYLKRFAPDLANITWQVYDTNLFRYQHFNSLLLPKRAIKKAWRILTRQQIIERNWEIQFLNDKGRRGLEQWLLRPGLHLHEFVSPDAVRALLDAFYQAPLENKRGRTVSMLLSFSAWLETYG